MNTIRLKLFPFSLKDKTKTWLQNLRSGSIHAWDEMQQQFLKKFFPSHRTNSFKRQITTFTQKLGEIFYQYWIGIETCLILALIMVFKHGDWFYIFMKLTSVEDYSMIFKLHGKKRYNAKSMKDEGEPLWLSSKSMYVSGYYSALI